jgi:hypothetical protein
MAALIVAIVLVGIPFARFTKDRLEPKHRHVHHVIVQR